MVRLCDTCGAEYYGNRRCGSGQNCPRWTTGARGSRSRTATIQYQPMPAPQIFPGTEDNMVEPVATPDPIVQAQAPPEMPADPGLALPGRQRAGSWSTTSVMSTSASSVPTEWWGPRLPVMGTRQSTSVPTESDEETPGTDWEEEVWEVLQESPLTMASAGHRSLVLELKWKELSIRALWHTPSGV